MTYDFSKLTAYLDALHSEKGLPAGDIIVYRNGQPVCRHAVGSAAPDTLYYLFSCTKPVTAAAGMQLVERGIIGLDDPVCRYLPAYGKALYRQQEVLLPVGDKLKVRHLFTMSGGLNYNCESPAIRRVLETNPNASTLDILPAFAEDTPLEFLPGTKFRYSLCLDVLAGVIEVAAGMRFADYLQQNIFDPLGMKDATLHLPDEKAGRLAGAYTVKDGRITETPVGIGPFGISPAYESGGAGLVCSASDYGKFAAAMSLGGISPDGVRILESKTVDLLRSPQMTEQQDFLCSMGLGYAYGFGVRTLVSKEKGAKSHIGEFGWDGAAGAFILMDPDARVAIVYTQQVLGWPGYFGLMHIPMRDLTYEALGL